MEAVLRVINICFLSSICNVIINVLLFLSSVAAVLAMAEAAATEQLLLLGIMVHGSMSMVCLNNIMDSNCYNNNMVVIMMCLQLCWLCRHHRVWYISTSGQDIVKVNYHYKGCHLYTVDGWWDNIDTTVCDICDQNQHDSCLNGLLAEVPF